MTGGSGDSGNWPLDSTETFDSDLGSWAPSGATLPRRILGLRAANIDGRVLIFGNYTLFIIHQVYHRNMMIAGGLDEHYDYYDEILEYDPEEDSMLATGQQMTHARAYHAVSVVHAEDYAKWCQQPSSSARLSPAVLIITFWGFKGYFYL